MRMYLNKYLLSYRDSRVLWGFILYEVVIEAFKGFRIQSGIFGFVRWFRLIERGELR